MRLVLCLGLSLLFSCSSGKIGTLTKEGEDVKVKNKVQEKCITLGKVVGLNEGGMRDLAENDARNKAASEFEADTIVIKEVIANGPKIEVNALAYRCKKD